MTSITKQQQYIASFLEKAIIARCESEHLIRTAFILATKHLSTQELEQIQNSMLEITSEKLKDEQYNQDYNELYIAVSTADVISIFQNLISNYI